MRLIGSLVALLCLGCWDVASASVFYEFTTIAQTGQAELTGLFDSPSVNDLGMVAFSGQLTAGQSVFVGDGTSLPRNITPGFVSATRRFSRAVQINNANQVIAQDSVTGSPPATLVRIWDGTGTSSFITVARGGFPTDPFDSVFSFPSVSNAGHTTFSALIGSTSLLVTPAGSLFNQVALTTPLRPMIDDFGRVLVRAGATASDPIRLYNSDLGGFVTIADSAGGWRSLGASPGISDDGSIVVFAGDRGQGPGIFASVDEGLGGQRKLITVAGENSGPNPRPELGLKLNAGGVVVPLFFATFDMDARVGVVRTAAGVPGIAQDSLVVAFVGTPSEASRENPGVPGKPLFFSNQKGIWTLRIDIDRPLAPAAGTLCPDMLSVAGLCYHPRTAIPVVQLLDTVQTPNGARIVNGLNISDPLARASTASTGLPRTEQRGDHRIVFWASSAADTFIVRGEHLDSDQDGLLDHWEKVGGGIDIDQDGVIDLDLSAMGANPLKRDVFLEIDWLTDRTDAMNESWSNALPPTAPGTIAQALVNVFKAAPAPGNGIPAGIELHIDAGPRSDANMKPFSANFPTGMAPSLLQGGDQIHDGAGQHIDVLYLKPPGAVAIPGIIAVDFHTVKDRYFGTGDKRARELAFHYSVLADFHSPFESMPEIPLTGTVAGSTSLTLTASAFAGVDVANQAVIVTSGAGQGQIRIIKSNTASQLTLVSAWKVLPAPGDSFAILSGSSGLAEIVLKPDANHLPGNDFVVTMGAAGVSKTGVNRFLGWPFAIEQTLLHELGHNLGLRHGGVDDRTSDSPFGPFAGDFKPDYISLMNYAYQLCNPPTGKNNPPYTTVPAMQKCPILSYSFPGDPVFSDWTNLKLDVYNSALALGNTFGISPGVTAAPPPRPEMAPRDSERTNGPVDLDAPDIAISSPGAGSVAGIGGILEVRVTATDNVGVDAVFIEFDVNGDGTIDPANELVVATKDLSGLFVATFGGITGVSGLRGIRANAVDGAGNTGIDVIQIQIVAALVTVPNVVGQTQAAAQTALTGVGLTVGTVTTASSATVPAGRVISQNPAAGTGVAAGSAVALVVSSGPAAVSVPNVVGQTQAAAQTALTGVGLTVGTVTTASSATVPAGQVISQNPAAGTGVAAGSAVALVVSSGPAAVSVPNVVGQTQAAAQTALTGVGLTVGTVTTASSATVPAGQVISQNPAAGTGVAAGSAVALVVSSGPAAVSVPNVVGQTQAAAQTALTGVGLTVGTVTTASSATVPAGQVISQNPAAGTGVAAGSAVALVVSSGPAAVSVPNVVGQTQAAAQTALTGVGLTVGTVTTASSATVPAGRVISQNPAAGTGVAAGSAVALVVSSGPAAVSVPNVVGQTQAAAQTALTGVGLTVGTVTTASSATVPAGQVISQNPAAGTGVAAGSAVALVVSSGPAAVSVPNVVGQTQAAAQTALTGVGLTVGTVTTASSATVPAGQVISQNPAAGTGVAAGSAVALVVSSGPAAVSVPNVVGQTQAAAQTALTGVGLTVGTVTTASSATVPAGRVISQNPAAGTGVAAGSAVALVVSSGPQAEAGTSTLCSVLGDDRARLLLDHDIFSFHGSKGERIRVALSKNPSGRSQGDRATLLLVDAIRGGTLFRSDSGVLPNSIIATLPLAGRYLIVVGEQPKISRGARFVGAYCVSLESSESAHESLEPYGQ